MASKSLGVLTLDLVAQVGGFTQGMDKAERSSAKWRKQVEKDMKVVKDRTVSTLKAGAAAATTFAAATAALTKAGMSSVTSQARLAKSLDTTYDSVTQLRAAFGDSGIDDFEASMNRLNRRLGAAELGRGAALNAVKELKLDLQELAQVDAAERVAIIADRIKDVATNSQTAARYAQDLGFEQREAASFFIQGGDAVRAYSENVEALGLSLSDIDAQKVIDAQNAMGAFGDITTAVSQKLASNFAPLLKAASEEVNNVAIEAGGVGVVVDDVFDRAVVGGIRTAASFRTVFKQLTSSLGDIWSGYQSLPPWAQEIGIVGALVGGKKGVLLVAAVSKAAEEAKVTAAWFAAYTQGDVGFFEWMSSGHGKAKERLKELGRDVDEIKTKSSGPSIIGSLFGTDDENDENDDQWAEDMITRYRRIQEESRKSAEQAINDSERAAQQTANTMAQMHANIGSDPLFEIDESLARRLSSLTRALSTEREAALREYTDTLAEINALEAEGVLISDKATNLRIRNAQRYSSAMQAILDKDKSYWRQWLESAQKALTDFDAMSASILDNFSRGFGNAFESMVFESKSFSDAISDMAVSMARSIVNAVGQMAAQWIAYQAVQLLVGKSTQAAAVTTLSANAQASSMQAGLNAYASIAAIPIVGPAAAPAAMAAAIAATQPMAAAVSSMALAGMAHDGIDSVPKTGTWLLEKGERVTTERTSAKLDRTLDEIRIGQQNFQAGGITQQITVNGDASEQTIAMVREAARTGAEEGYRMVLHDFRRNGPARQMLKGGA